MFLVNEPLLATPSLTHKNSNLKMVKENSSSKNIRTNPKQQQGNKLYFPKERMDNIHMQVLSKTKKIYESILFFNELPNLLHCNFFSSFISIFRE